MEISRRSVALASLVPAGGAVLLLFAGLGANPEPATPVRPPGRVVAPAQRAAKTAALSPAGAARGAGAPRAADVCSLAERKLPAAEAVAGRLAPIVARITQAHENGDEAGLEAARGDLAALIERDPVAALAGLLKALRAATAEDEIGLLGAILVSEGAFPRAEVLAAFDDMARRDEVPARRAAGLRGLADLPGADVARLEQVAALGRRDPDPTVREAGGIALGSLGDRSPGPMAASAARNLVEGLGSETNPRVKATLLYAIRDTRDPVVAGALLGSLADGDASVRAAAAEALGDVAAAHRPRAVAALAERFAQESDRDLRVTIVTAIVKAGRLDALPALEKLRGGDLQPTIDDYTAGLRSGEDNADRLFALHLAAEQSRAQGVGTR